MDAYNCTGIDCKLIIRVPDEEDSKDLDSGSGGSPSVTPSGNRDITTPVTSENPRLASLHVCYLYLILFHYFLTFQKDLSKELKVKEGLEKFMSTDTTASRIHGDDTKTMLEVRLNVQFPFKCRYSGQ